MFSIPNVGPNHSESQSCLLDVEALLLHQKNVRFEMFTIQIFFNVFRKQKHAFLYAMNKIFRFLFTYICSFHLLLCIYYFISK